MGGALPVQWRTTQPAGRQPFRWRARPCPDCPADASARRRAPAGRADQRSRHSDARDPGREPAGISRRAGPGHARSLHAGSRVDGGRWSRRPRQCRSIRRLFAVGSVAGRANRRCQASDLEGHAQRKTNPPQRRQKKKLSYLEAREYATIEQRVADAEATLAAKQAAMEDPAIATDAARIVAAHAEYDEARRIVDELIARWAELESKLG